MDTFRKNFGDKAFSFIELKGKKVYEFENTLFSAYEDDIGYIMGENILYLKRHIERVFLELKDAFKNVLTPSLYEFAFKTTDGS